MRTQTPHYPPRSFPSSPSWAAQRGRPSAAACRQTDFSQRRGRGAHALLRLPRADADKWHGVPETSVSAHSEQRGRLLGRRCRLLKRRIERVAELAQSLCVALGVALHVELRAARRPPAHLSATESRLDEECLTPRTAGAIC